jgi:hypothetical protein
MDKWYWIGMAAFLCIMGAGAAYSEHSKGQCRIEAMKVGKSAEDIAKICK